MPRAGTTNSNNQKIIKAGPSSGFNTNSTNKRKRRRRAKRTEISSSEESSSDDSEGEDGSEEVAVRKRKSKSKNKNKSKKEKEKEKEESEGGEERITKKAKKAKKEKREKAEDSSESSDGSSLENEEETEMERKRVGKLKTTLQEDASSSSSEEEEREEDPTQEAPEAPNGHSTDHRTTTTARIPSPLRDQQDSQAAARFENYYMQLITGEFGEELNAIRQAKDFNDRSLPMLVRALKQGVNIFDAAEKRLVLESMNME